MKGSPHLFAVGVATTYSSQWRHPPMFYSSKDFMAILKWYSLGSSTITHRNPSLQVEPLWQLLLYVFFLFPSLFTLKSFIQTVGNINDLPLKQNGKFQKSLLESLKYNEINRMDEIRRGQRKHISWCDCRSQYTLSTCIQEDHNAGEHNYSYF